MKKTPLKYSVAEATDLIKKSLTDKGFTLFNDIDHQANAKSVDLEMPASRVIIFGNPVAGTKLMQKDISASLDLPIRLAVVDDNNQTLLIHQITEDFEANYLLKNHPILDKVEALFSTLSTELNE